MKTALAMFILAVLSSALAQGDGITFDVEIFRIDSMGVYRPAEEGLPGETIEYRITATNEGDIVYRPGTVVVTLPIGEGVCFVNGSATPSSDRLTTEFSADGGSSFGESPSLPNDQAVKPEDYDAVRWTFETPFDPAQSEMLTYRVLVDCLGSPATPATRASPPAGAYSVDEFAFDRVRVLDAGESYVQVVGEVSSRTRFESVAFRVTLYGRSGQILGTDTFIVDAVGSRPRVFDTLVSRVDAAEVSDYALQVEWTR